MDAHDLLRSSLVLASLVPAAFVVAALLVSRRSPFGAAAVVTSVSVGLAGLAVALRAGAALMPAVAGPRPRTILRGLVQLDLATCAMLLLVCTLSVVVVRYSRTYLVGEEGLVRYARSLVLTLAAVTILVISNELALLVAAWLATGIGLHQLLTFYEKRRQAVIVAHKTFLLARIADLFFFASLLLVDGEVGSLHIDAVNAFARAHPSLTPPLHLATVLLVVGVLLKTAQLPFHGWILQVMEAPTPVSALLHAGVVNIGGFVMIRLAPLMTEASTARGVLIGVGLVTAIIGSLAMTARMSIKVVLAWSTIAQMGFMLVQCGLGAWHLALLHLLAHSLYKAHSFLSAGSVVEAWRATSLVKPRKPSLANLALSLAVLAVAAAPFTLAYSFAGRAPSASLGPLALALGLSFAPMLARAIAAGPRAFSRAALFTAGATAAYFAWHVAFEAVAPSLAPDETASSGWSAVVVGLVVLFVAQTTLQMNPRGRLARFLLPHLLSGLYIDDWFTRLTFRLWPPRLERPATASQRSSVTLEAR